MFDHTHDIQQAYRYLVSALSLPGTIVDLSTVASRIEPPPTFNPVMLLLAMTLLDAETGFSVFGAGTAVADSISHRTYARSVPPNEAGYIFVLGVDTDPRPAIEIATDGTLVDPHLGATVFLEVDRLRVGAGAAGTRKAAFRLQGPGIDGTTGVDIESRFDWYSARNDRVREYPLGIDLFLVDRYGAVLGMPRTTCLVRVGEVEWVT